jgi:hypothetical protein
MANARVTSSALVVAVSTVPGSGNIRATSSAIVLAARVIPRGQIINPEPPRFADSGVRTFGGAQTFKKGN